MEHRQRVEHLVELVEVDPGRDLGAVGQDVAVAEHDTLGPALRARGEQDHGRIVALHAEPAVDAAGEQAVPQAAQPVERCRPAPRRSSSQRNLAWPPMAAIDGSSLALATNSPEEITSLTWAVTMAASRLAGPAEKLSMAGTRPKACSAKKMTAAALTLGSSTPTRSPGSVTRGELAAQHQGARPPASCSRHGCRWCPRAPG